MWSYLMPFPRQRLQISHSRPQARCMRPKGGKRVPLDEIGRGDRLVLEFTDGEGGSMGGYFLPEGHLDTRTITHGRIENRFSNGDVLAGTLGEFCDKRVELLCIVVHQRGLHRFVTGMEGK